ISYVEKSLSYVALGAFVNSVRICLTLHLWERRHGLTLDRPVREEFLELLAEISSIEIPRDGQHDVFRKEVPVIERLQILTLDVVDVLVLHLPAIRIVPAIDNRRELSVGDAVCIIVSTRDSTFRLRFGEI